MYPRHATRHRGDVRDLAPLGKAGLEQLVVGWGGGGGGGSDRRGAEGTHALLGLLRGGEARVRSGQRDRLTTRLRELGGLIRAAGDLAVQEGAPLVETCHVDAACENTRTLEEQMARRTEMAVSLTAPLPQVLRGEQPANSI